MLIVRKTYTKLHERELWGEVSKAPVKEKKQGLTMTVCLSCSVCLWSLTSCCHRCPLRHVLVQVIWVRKFYIREIRQERWYDKIFISKRKQKGLIQKHYSIFLQKMKLLQNYQVVGSGIIINTGDCSSSRSSFVFFDPPSPPQRGNICHWIQYFQRYNILIHGTISGWQGACQWCERPENYEIRRINIYL